MVAGQEIKRLVWKFLQVRGVLPGDLKDLVWTGAAQENQAGLRAGGQDSPRASSGRPPWAACSPCDDRHEVISSWLVARGPLAREQVDLTCGRPDGGAEDYWHIKKNHEADWTQVASMAPFRVGRWRDLADLVITKSLRDPERYGHRKSNNTTCYTAKLFLVNRSNGRRVYQMYAQIAVSNNNLVIVTAFPRKEKGC